MAGASQLPWDPKRGPRTEKYQEPKGPKKTNKKGERIQKCIKLEKNRWGKKGEKEKKKGKSKQIKKISHGLKKQKCIRIYKSRPIYAGRTVSGV